MGSAASPENLPPLNRVTLGLTDLIAACRQLDTDEILTVLRQRYLPIRHLGAEPIIAATDKLSNLAARKAGVVVAARARRQDLLLALQTVFGKSLIARASTQLCRLHPAFSARTALRLWQKIAIFAAAPAAGFLYFAASDLISGFLVLMFSMVFLAGIAIRLLSLTHTPVAGARAASPVARR